MSVESIQPGPSGETWSLPYYIPGEIKPKIKTEETRLDVIRRRIVMKTWVAMDLMGVVNEGFEKEQPHE